MSRGQFVWYELMTSDTEAAKAFYAKVVGWEMKASAMGSPDYTLLHAGESPVAGLMTLPQEARDQGGRPGWIGYIGVEDVDAMAAAVTANGGRIHRAPEDMGEIGRFAVAMDPQGAAFVLFQPFMAPGAPAPKDAPGTCGWRELMAADGPSAFDFYAAVFGWTKGDAMDMGAMGVYQLFKTGGEDAVGGMMTKPPQIPAPYWTYYFMVDAIPAAVERIATAGGTVINGPMEVPGGLWIVQGLDPQGVLFSLLGKG